MLSQATLMLALSSPADANEAKKPVPSLATYEACSASNLQPGEECISDLRAEIRKLDGLTFMRLRRREGQGSITAIDYYYLGGMDYKKGPEDTDGQISPWELVYPQLTATRLTPNICNLDDLWHLDKLLENRAISEHEYAAMKDVYSDPKKYESKFFDYCSDVALLELVSRQMQVDFNLFDINKDGLWSMADDVNKDNAITAEDLVVKTNTPAAD